MFLANLLNRIDIFDGQISLKGVRTSSAVHIRFPSLFCFYFSRNSLVLNCCSLSAAAFMAVPELLP